MYLLSVTEGNRFDGKLSGVIYEQSDNLEKQRFYSNIVLQKFKQNINSLNLENKLI